MIIKEIHERLSSGQGFCLLRKVSEIFAYPMAIVSAGVGKPVFQFKYKFLEDEYKSYLQDKTPDYSWLQYLLATIDDQETKTAVNLLISLRKKNVNIFKLYNDAKAAKVNRNYTIATVFTSKGLEFETVYIADDLNARIGKIREDGGIKSHGDLVAFRCYFVAASRCGVNLINATSL
jgi:ATP-dependent exoDNAse (exonuclease V) beta subunit